jgi:four helix bundle protein
MRDFRKYDIWRESVDFSTNIYIITSTFPKFEIYGLCDQLQRASVSISSNIAEGCSRSSEKEFAHFLEMSIGSAFEVESQLLISKNLGYIDDEKYDCLITTLSAIERQIHTLIKKLRS